MDNYVCSVCGKSAYYDGRCGDGPILMCGCDNPHHARAIPKDDYSPHTVVVVERVVTKPVPAERWDNWGREDD